jgi:LmbE family N-acetylglucosaminyl deacetylase
MAEPIKVLALFAHPDDAEFLCAGTLAHLAERGAHIHIATMTAGDCGSTILPAARISRIRRGEAQRAAQLIGASYRCLGGRDLLVLYDAPTIRKVLEVVRQVDPDLVLTHSQVDYMVDHETAGRLTQTGCFAAMAPNFRTGARRPAKATRAVPHLYYAQPFGGRDIHGDEIRSRVYVDITSTFELKERMLACHASQQAWLRAQQEIPRPQDPLHEMATHAGTLSGFRLAEGFRQHLGQGFPQNNLLGRLLGDLVRVVES